jgi:hypothetical protein
MHGNVKFSLLDGITAKRRRHSSVWQGLVNLLVGYVKVGMG